MAVEREDGRRLLAAMLQGMQSKSRDGGGGGMAENSENPAFLSQAVGVEVKIESAGTRVLPIQRLPPIQRPSAKIKALCGVLRFTHRQPFQSFSLRSGTRPAPNQQRCRERLTNYIIDIGPNVSIEQLAAVKIVGDHRFKQKLGNVFPNNH